MRATGSEDSPVHIRDVEILGRGRYILRRYTLDYLRRDGTRALLRREACVRGEGAAVLLYSPSRRAVFLTRQFRLPVFLDGFWDGMLIEVPAGLLDGESPTDAVRREAEEETGFHLGQIEHAFSGYMSPALALERTHFFLANVDLCERPSTGGGVYEEGEDIDVLELPVDDATDMIERGEIVDVKTIVLILHAKLKGLL